MQDIEDWLDEKIAEIVHTPGYYEEPSVFDGEAEGLMAAAIAEGYTQADVLDVCGGDVSKYIMDRQNAFTDAEVASKD